MLLIIFVVVLLQSIWTALYAQSESFEVSGIVSGEIGPIPGVSIYVKGIRCKGTITVPGGFYNLSVTSSKDALVFSFVGMKTLEEVLYFINL